MKTIDVDSVAAYVTILYTGNEAYLLYDFKSKMIPAYRTREEGIIAHSKSMQRSSANPASKMLYTLQFQPRLVCMERGMESLLSWVRDGKLNVCSITGMAGHAYGIELDLALVKPYYDAGYPLTF